MPDENYKRHLATSLKALFIIPTTHYIIQTITIKLTIMVNARLLPFAGICLSLALCMNSCKKTTHPTEQSKSGSPEVVDDITTTTSRKTPSAYPDHIIFVWLENKGYSQIIGSSDAPYINYLVSKGTLFTNSHGLTHPSYPNYIGFFSGGTQRVTTNDCIDGTPFSTANLYTVLKAAGKSFAWYSEDLPAIGSTICGSGNYREKHNPVTIFSNVSTLANKPFSAFPTDYTQLENVVCITPNLIDDMHDGSIRQGDTWVQNNLGGLAEWCRTHNSIFVVYWDEDNGDDGNRIPVVAVGQHVRAGYKLSTQYDHYNWTKTACALFKAPTDWTPNLTSRSLITGCWQ